MNVLVLGACVACAVWCAVVPTGRRAATLAAFPERGRSAAGGGTVTLRRAVRAVVRRPSPRAGGDPVRVTVAQVVGLLRAGTPPGAAWSRAVGVPTAHDGTPDPVALADVVGDRSDAAAILAAARLSRDVGAPLGGILETVGAALVARTEADAERDASLAGPRATARVLLWLPALGVLLGWVLGADPLATATDGGVGTAAVVAGVAALLAGRWWTGRLVAAAREAGEAS